jgi:dipeptidase
MKAFQRLLIAVLYFTHTCSASYAFYVGKSLTHDGSVMLGGTGEEVSSHWLEMFPARNHDADETITVGVTEDASMPGRLINISQASHTFRYISIEYSDFEGFPAPLTNGGVNEKGVAVRDVWAQNRDDLIAMTPNPQTGLQYSDLARIILERASTAREGVQIIGQLIAEYGYADYGGNSHLIADANEGWVVWEMSGGQKLWAAERLGDDDVRVLYPGYIEDFPLNFANHSDYMGSPNIVSFAIEHGYWSPNSTDQRFNIFKAYGVQGANYTARNGGFKYMSQAALEDATRTMAPVTEQDLIARVRDFRISDDEAGYGKVVSLHASMDPDLIRMWIAPTSSVTAPFVPWWLGVTSIPPEFGQHRYLTKDAASTFLDVDFQFQEATQFVGRVFKQVLYYTCSDPDAFLPIVQSMLAGFENASFTDVEWVQKSAEMLVRQGMRSEALDLVGFYAHARAEKALGLGRTIVDALDTWVKMTGRYRGPSGSKINDPGKGAETVNCLVGWDPDRPAVQQKLGTRFMRQG